jgi:hypothetical protein
MLTGLTRNDDSRGIGIPAAPPEQSGIQDMVELLTQKRRLVIRKERTARTRWEEAVASVLQRVEMR